MSTRMPTTGTLEFYRARAQEARREAADTRLENVRLRCLHSADAWDVLADRIARHHALRDRAGGDAQPANDRAQPAQAHDAGRPRRDKELPFGAWLLRQAHRDDTVGSLARRVEGDRDFPRDGDPGVVRARLRMLGFQAGIIGVIDEAVLDWIGR